MSTKGIRTLCTQPIRCNLLLKFTRRTKSIFFSLTKVSTKFFDVTLLAIPFSNILILLNNLGIDLKILQREHSFQWRNDECFKILRTNTNIYSSAKLGNQSQHNGLMYIKRRIITKHLTSLSLGINTIIINNNKDQGKHFYYGKIVPTHT